MCCHDIYYLCSERDVDSDIFLCKQEENFAVGELFILQ